MTRTKAVANPGAVSPSDGEPASRAQRRLPRGYQGLLHETIGSDVQALVQAVLMPELVLGKELFDKVQAVDGARWYPIAMLLEPLERLDGMLGPSSLRKVGLEIFKLSHEAAFRANASSGRDIVYGIDVMYHRANRGTEIGGWRVLSFEPGAATLEKTTPHHCVMEEGILEAGFRALGIPSVIYQTRCFRKGDEVCEYRITSDIADDRWMGTPKSGR